MELLPEQLGAEHDSALGVDGDVPQLGYDVIEGGARGLLVVVGGSVVVVVVVEISLGLHDDVGRLLGAGVGVLLHNYRDAPGVPSAA